VQLANDIKVLMHWLSHDILALAGPSLEERQELFDFIVAELSQRESQLPRLRPLRTALKKRDDLLAFAKVLDEKLVEIAHRFDTPEYLVGCLLCIESLFLCLLAALESSAPSASRKISSPDDRCTTALQQTPRASSLVENLTRLPSSSTRFPVSGLATIFPQSSHLYAASVLNG